MKLKILFLIVLLFSVNIYSQEQKISVEVSLKETALRTRSKSIPVKIKITNMSDQAINTADFGGINLYFSKCPQTKRCNTRDDVFYASSAVKSETLKKYQSLETEVNLADLYWVDSISNTFDTNFPKNLFTVPSLNKYFFADVQLPKGSVKVEGISGGIPLNKSFGSNEIEVSLSF